MMQPTENESRNGCDSHLHIIDPRFPGRLGDGGLYRNAAVTDYCAVRERLGMRRAVIVQPKYYGTDNTCLLDALSQIGDDARGIAVVAPDTNRAALRHLDAHGVRGLRFSVWNDSDTVMTIDMIEGLAHRITDLGWHVQLHMSGDQICQHAELLQRLPGPVVLDHMTRLPPGQGVQHPAWPIVQRLLERGDYWVKLSGAYLNSDLGAPDYPEATTIAHAFVKTHPERLVWGSDWPHVTETQAGRNVDTPMLRTLFERWVPNSLQRHRILVENPQQLYGFDSKH